MTLKVMALGADDDGGSVDAGLFAFNPPAFCSEGEGMICGEGAINGEELTAEGNELAGLVFGTACHEMVCRVVTD